MAKLSDLTRVVAAATGEAHPGLVVLARALRQSDLVATGGRGNNAARMSYVDAANLLLGVASPGDNTTANRTVAVVGALRLVRMASARLRGGRTVATLLDGSEAVAALTAGQSLSSSLAQLLHSYKQDAGLSAIIIDPKFIDMMPSSEIEIVMDRPGELFQDDMRPGAIRITITKSLFPIEAKREPTWGALVEIMFAGQDLVRLNFTTDGEMWAVQSPLVASSKMITERVEPSVIDAVVSCIRADEPSPEPDGFIS